jgi:Tfp pilus assembly protein PilN
MFELNLIKQKVKFVEKRDKFYQGFRIFYGVLFLICLFGAFQFAVTSYKIAASKRERYLIDTKIASSKEAIGVDKLEKEWEGYYGDVCRIEGVFGNKTSWARRLYALSTIVPPRGLCIDSINYQNIQDQQRLILEVVIYSGEKQEFEIINDFMKSLEKSKYFTKEVKLESQEKRLVNGKNVELFRISVALGTI